MEMQRWALLRQDFAVHAWFVAFGSVCVCVMLLLDDVLDPKIYLPRQVVVHVDSAGAAVRL